jgi:Helicase conserved C-terminal domain
MTTVEDRERFVSWLGDRVVRDARGEDETVLPGRPDKRLWLGRVAPEETAWKSGLGERGRRLDPCSIGIRFQPRTWSWRTTVSFLTWALDPESAPAVWRKGGQMEVQLELEIPAGVTDEPLRFGEAEFARALSDAGEGNRRAARVEVDVEEERGKLVANVSFVNAGDEQARKVDPNLYEVDMELEVGEIDPIELDALPDSFRYDRRIPAFGLYCGVEYDAQTGTLRTTDQVAVDRMRPDYWDDSLGPEPDLRFERLSENPIGPLSELADALERWGESHWGGAALDAREVSEGWTEAMRAEADREAGRFAEEVRRVRAGIEVLSNDDAQRAFRMANRAFLHSGRGKYEGWRPFQIGFLLTVLPSLVDSSHSERETVDTLWFATGGGKTETYLAAVVFTCLYDRLRGKRHGISAWSRFPLRMLSLQQTQRFADALAGAELARRAEGVEGDPIGLGFLVGGPPSGTPNRIRDDGANNGEDAGDPEMPARHRVLLSCPFCFADSLEMRFDRRSWRLLHVCTADDCSWQEEGLPFFVVDEEIYRFLPSVVIGTLDKAASVSFQAANRGLYASPIARCERDGHGFSYAPRSATPEGCLVPGCTGKRKALDQPLELFAPSLRAQDELHLLRDSLGAVDSHYETLLDHLYRETKSPPAKLLASSATLAGYEGQVDTLYRRPAGVFPLPGPAAGSSYWSRDGERLARRFIGLAPRGVTLDFANDRLAESLQRAVRRLLAEPEAVCTEAGVDPACAAELLDEYGAHVVYGMKLRDVEAAVRSFEQQPGVAPLNVATLTGRTALDQVRNTLSRLANPEPGFEDRLHIVCASAMMSHGVDVDRFNVITLLGLPLSTAEFIQASARIGRRWPGLVFVLHRMGIERDASAFRSFRPFVEQGDRFIAPIAITRRSRRVLEQTFAGLFAARVLGIHEARRVRAEKRNISTARALREYFQAAPIEQAEELRALCDALAIDPDAEDPLEGPLRRLLQRTYDEIEDVASNASFVSDVTPSPPMRSLRDIEMQVPVYAPEGDL